MRPLAGHGILLIKGAFVLIDQDSVLMKGFIAVPVKFPGKQSLAGPEGIRGIHNDKILAVMGRTDEFQSVLIENMKPRIVKGTGGLRQIFF